MLCNKSTAFVVLALVTMVASQVVKTVAFSGTVFDHPQDMMDMQRPNGGCNAGMVMDDLGPDRNPVYRGSSENSTFWNPNLLPWPPRGQYLPPGFPIAACQYTPQGGSKNPTGDYTTGKAHFDDWFRVSPKYSIPVPIQLILNETAPGSGVFQFDRKLPKQFFPVNKLGWGDDDQNTGAVRLDNFYFCMSLHAMFLYNGTETFSFSGDDDVWVFVNGKLVVDIGGTHGATDSAVTLSDVATKAGLVIGRRHTFDFFVCERHLTRSNCLFTTSIVPLNEPPVANDMVYIVAQGATVTDVMPAFDADGDALTFTIVNAAAVPTFTLSGNTFSFTAPADRFRRTYQVVFNARDGEFTTCNSIITFEVDGLPPGVVAPPPPPATPRKPSKAILSKEATIAIAVVGSVLVIAAIVGVIGVILYTRAKWHKWESDIHAALTKEGLLNNPLYEGNGEEQFNPMYEQ